LTQDLHGASSQKTAFFVVTAVKTSNPTEKNVDNKTRSLNAVGGFRMTGYKRNEDIGELKSNKAIKTTTKCTKING
jgi:hypothetical protein